MEVVQRVASGHGADAYVNAYGAQVHYSTAFTMLVIGGVIGIISVLRHVPVLPLAIAAVTLGGMVSLYQTLFSLWMTAHPLYHSPAWQHRFYLRLTTTVIIGIVWLASIITWLQRRRLLRR